MGKDRSRQRPLFRFRRLLAGLLAYLGVMAFVLSFLFEAVSLDTSEQVLWTQTLRLGYGIQPPLLQWAVFAVFGVTVAALVLTKEVLIATTAITTYFIVRRQHRGEAAEAERTDAVRKDIEHDRRLGSGVSVRLDAAR
ncbi:MAG: hypothetical protein ACRED0_12000 [Gammaproteobacteria bacterium]